MSYDLELLSQIFSFQPKGLSCILLSSIVVNELPLILFGNILTLPSFLNDNFTGYRILST